MGHYIISSSSVRNIQIALEHSEWGMTRNRPINIGDTIELRTKKNAEDGGDQHIASAIVTSEPTRIQNPGFQWPDGEYPIRFNFRVIQVTPPEIRNEVDETLRRVIRNNNLQSQYIWVGGEDIGDDIWSEFMRNYENLVG